MKTMLAIAIVLLLTACQNMSQYSAKYQEAHEKAFWSEYKGGGVDAAAWANLKAHEAAEKQVGK